MDKYLLHLKEQRIKSKSVLLFIIYTVPWVMTITMLVGLLNVAAICLSILLFAPITLLVLDALLAFLGYKYER